jgi:hypothetical protein
MFSHPAYATNHPDGGWGEPAILTKKEQIPPESRIQRPL